MAARKRKVSHDEATREKIRTSQLLNRLQSNGLGKLKNPLSMGEIKSIEICLRKVLPDLTAVDHSGEVNHNHVARVPEAQPDIDTWQHKHGNGATTIQ